MAENEQIRRIPKVFFGGRRVATECFGGMEYNREKVVRNPHIGADIRKEIAPPWDKQSISRVVSPL